MFPRFLTKSVSSIALGLAVLLTAGPLANGQATSKDVDTTKANAKSKAKTKAKAAEKPSALIDLNKASAAELEETLPGVGAATAKKIVDGRPYASIDDLARAGVSARTIEGMRSLVTVSAPPPPVAVPTEKAAAKKKAAEKPTALIDLNKASAAELEETLPGVGAATAKKIVEGRPYLSVDDLSRAGVSARTIEGMRSLVTVSAPPPLSSSPAAVPAEKAAAKKKAAEKPTALIDLNKASAAELEETLPGVGAATAKKIVDGRPYLSVDDLSRAGVSARTIEGMRSLVTVSAPPPAAVPAEKAAAKKKAAEKPTALIDLNKASAAELEETLPGVGAATAKKIVDGRPYASVDDLSRAGVSARTIEGMRSLVTVSAAPPSSPAAVPAEKAAAKTKAAEKPTALIDLNKASAAELEETLPGVGAATARKIVDGRPYASVDDLARAGVSAKTIEGMRSMVTVSAPPRSSPAAVSAEKAAAKKVAKAARPAGGKRVNLNTALKADLDALPGIGPVKAQGIIEGRPFKSIEDIMKVKGIKEFEFSLIKDMITVE